MSRDLRSPFEFPGKYYEVIRRDFRSVDRETEFLREYLGTSGSVLDLGCGTGTTLRALAKLGHQCAGIDPSRHFVDYAREMGGDIQYLHSTAAEAELFGRFDLVTCLFVTLNYMPPGDVPRVLAKVHDWLRPEGHFVLDVAHLLNFVDNFQPYIIAHHVDENVLITRLTRHTVRPHEANWRHDETVLVRDGEDVSMYYNSFDQYVYSLRELHSLLHSAGLTVVDEFGSFDRAAPTGKGHRILVVRRRD